MYKGNFIIIFVYFDVKLMINGKLIYDEIEIYYNDRYEWCVVLGSLMFIFVF